MIDVSKNVQLLKMTACNGPIYIFRRKCVRLVVVRVKRIQTLSINDQHAIDEAVITVQVRRPSVRDRHR